MSSKIIQTLIILAVAAAAFSAFYFRKPHLENSPLQKPPIEQVPVIPVTLPPEVVVPSKQETPAFSATFTVPVDTKFASHFGLLGESRADDFGEQQINTVVLNQLFETLKARDVKAIFFTGNLVAGVESSDNENKPIDSQKLRKNLEQFSQLYESILGSSVPFFPTLGDREVVINKGAETYIDHFHLNGAVLLEDEFLYTVSAGQAFFAVIATDELSAGQTVAKQTFSSKMQEWLQRALKEGAKTHKYLFVIGYEPAYPSTTTFLKTQMPQRDSFWKILIENKVLAYFSSKERLFDRSNRYGVWQIISGGGGTSLNPKGESLPFFHSLVLTIPGEKENVSTPKIQVIDNKGEVIEEFVLSPENQPLYQRRIS